MAGPIGGYRYSSPGFGRSALQQGVGTPVIAAWPSSTSANSTTIVATPPPNLDANSGAFVLTGNDAGMDVGLPASSGSFALTGFAASDAVGEPLGSGAFSLTGYAATLIATRKLAAASGSFAFTGYSTTLNVGMPAGSGTFALTGYSAALSASVHATWDSAHTSADITLSGGSLVATQTTTVFNSTVLGNTAAQPDRAFEVVFSSIGANAGVGLCAQTQVLSSYVGDGTSGLGYYADGAILDGGVVTSGPTYTTGDVITVERRADNSINFYKNGTFVYGAIRSGTLYPGVTLGHQSDVVTANFGASALSYLPVGDRSWDGSQSNFPNLAAGSGAFALTGNPLGINVGLPLSSGAFALTGNSATLTPGNRNLAAGSGAFSLTGQPASMGVQVTVASGSFVLSGGTLSFAANEALGSGAFAITGYDAGMAIGEGTVLRCAGDPISEAAIVSASLLMFRRKYPLSAQPKNTARSLEVPFDALIRREEPDFARERRRQPEYDFTNHTFEADPSNRGAYEAP